MKKILLVGVAAGVIGAWPAGAGAATFHGIVVGKQRGSVLVASPAGLVRAFSGHAAVGSRVVLRGGTLAVVGRTHRAHLRGIVVRRIGRTMFISSNRHLVAVHTGRGLASASDTTPSTAAPAGDQVSTQLTVNGGQLEVESEDDLGPASTSTLQVQAVVKSVAAGTVTLTVNGQDLTLSLPGGLTLPQSMIGQTVTLNVSVAGQNGEDDQVESDDNGNNDNSGSGSSGSADGGGDN